MIINFTDVVDHDHWRMMVTVEITDRGETKKYAHFLPKDTIEWRMAEYELDPADTETALDIVLFEPHAQAQVPKDKGLYQAASVADARAALVAAVRGVKQVSENEMAAQGQAKASEAARRNVDTRSRVLGLSWVDLNTVAVKRARVQHLRNNPRPPMTMEQLNAAHHRKDAEVRKGNLGG